MKRILIMIAVMLAIVAFALVINSSKPSWDLKSGGTLTGSLMIIKLSQVEYFDTVRSATMSDFIDHNIGPCDPHVFSSIAHYMNIGQRTEECFFDHRYPGDTIEIARYILHDNSSGEGFRMVNLRRIHFRNYK